MGSSVRKGRAVQQAEPPRRAAKEDFHQVTQNTNNGRAITASRTEDSTKSSTKSKDAELILQIQSYIDKNTVVIFSNTTCSLSTKVKELFKSMKVPYFSLELDQTENGQKLQEALYQLTLETSVPVVFVQQQQIGDYSKTLKAHEEGKLQKLLEMNGPNHLQESYDYDLIVIGGGSGGLAAAKEAVKYDKKVMVLDYVTPTPLGTSWGLGGTCVNVGCIPKKLMHQAALLGQALKDSRKFGWQFTEEAVKHSWETMTEAVQNYIGSLNWGYRVALRDNKVTYENAYGEFVGPHTIKATNTKGKEKLYTAEKFIIATGERPRYLNIPGDKEYCISSDDLFSLPHCPGKTLVVGASYVALECAGFLAGIGLDVTVMVRSILLRGFDQEMANKIGEHMEEHGIKFIKQFVPTKVEQIEEGTPGKLKVIAKSTTGSQTIEGEYNTVLLAVGRDACTRKIGLDKVGVKINKISGKIPANDEEQTNVPYIYAIGDVLEDKLELTPVAIQAGRLLTQRLYAGATLKCDYVNVPTTVFTPMEYGACGFSEEKAMEKFGENNIEVYHSFFWPLEWTVPGRDNNKCYAKIICNIQDNKRVIGFHVLGPNAGEVTQGFAAAIKCGLTKEQLDSTIGIHPVCAEIFTTLSVTKRSGGNIVQSGC
ncbi:PREDICTED: thioredoxin reductase 1, cytoplasmic isoform X1 [Gavialis gangeticus]|uniref:thioredoxin reductase 1, cytoplasmic isoform X1 n=1 Tax=Gavialis gangeticus TaxID=94835 RepID=UPI00092E4C3D|nr:PREDICTED: thioredoxin reductase 1, cytoplasmic isoform X1 [Gavialis gangeticus]